MRIDGLGLRVYGTAFRVDGGPPSSAVGVYGHYIQTWKKEFKLPWREAGPPNHYDDKVDSDQ